MLTDKKTSKLTDLQESFCIEYIKDNKGKAAAIRAGYEEANAATTASRMLKNNAIKARINELRGEIREQALISVNEVVQDLIEVKKEAMKQVNDMFGGRRMANATAALKAIELLGKHLAMFTDKQELTGANGGAIVVNSTVSFISAPKRDDDEQESDTQQLQTARNATRRDRKAILEKLGRGTGGDA